MTKLVSIITASIHKEKLCGLFDNLESTANDMNSFEVLVKVDDDHREMVDYMETEKQHRPFLIRYIVTPKLDGYWSIYLALNDLLKIALEETYFVWIPNDEIRFATQNWDNIIRRYRGLFPDDVFYLRVSGNRHRQCSLVDCCPSGEHLGFFTKNWLHLTEGFGRGAADTGMELINYYLKNKCGQIRSIPIDDIEFANLEQSVSAGHGLSEKQWEQKQRRIHALYAKLLSIGSQENIYRLAQKLNAYIWARKEGLSDFQIRDDSSAKKILIKEKSQSNPSNSFPYKLSIADWFGSILDSIERDQKYLRWPPVLASLIQARRKLAETWISISPVKIERAYFDDLEKAHKMLCNIFKNHFGFQNELLRLTKAQKGLVDELVGYISCDFYAPSESAFADELFANLSSGICEPLATQYSLAATLYGYIPQKATTCEGIKTDALQVRENVRNMKAMASGQNAGLYKNQQPAYLRKNVIMLDDYKVGLLTTMPKSGSWYNSYFFYFYDQLLRGNTNVTAELPKEYTKIINLRDTIGLDAFFMIGHCVCPGSHQHLGKFKRAWDELCFYVGGFNGATDRIKDYIHLFDPSLNKNVRIAYYYRNPLDQAVSFFRHALNHKDQRHRYRKDSQENMVLMTSVKEYTLHVGLEAYIKQFLTWKIMKQIYPDNILLIKYENLVRNPECTFVRVLEHFGHDVSEPSHKEKIAQAIVLSSKDSMQKIENLIGYSIGNDQIDPKERHIRDGAIGKWKGYFNKDDLKSIEKGLNLFDLSLADFEIE